MIVRSILALASFMTLVGAMSLAPLWTVSIDSRSSSQWIAESAGRVYAISGNHLIAIDAQSGRTIWSSDAEAAGAPAVAASALAVPVKGAIAFIDTHTGATLRMVRVRGNDMLASSNSTIVAIDDFDGSVTGYSADGNVKWQRLRVADSSANIEALAANTVALVGRSDVLVLDASNGHAVASADDVNEIVGADGRYLWFSVADGGIKGLDLDTNRSVAIHGAIVRDAVRVEHGTAVAVIDGRLRSVDLAHGGAIKPLHIYGRWIGGPLDGKILIERADGLYLQGLNAGDRPEKAASYANESQIVTSDRKVAYVGLRNGNVLVVDVQRGALLNTLHTGCDFFEGFAASGSTALIHCDASKRTQLIGFARSSL